jgi:O-antigen ligase/tetratricopeptide (TPR) repeat protein
MVLPRHVVALDRTIEVLVWGMLAWLPFAFGGVLPLSHMVLVGGSGLAALLFAARCGLGGGELVVSKAFVPLLLFLGLVWLQTVPGGAGLGAENDRLWREGLAPALQQPFAPPLTLSPAATAADLRLLVALGVLFAVAAQVLRSQAALRRLLTVVAVVGGALAVVALLQNLSGSDSLLWLRKAPGGRATAGPFVHYGHFSQFVNLTLGAGLGLLLLRLAERDQRNQYAVEDLVRDLGAPDRRLDQFLFGFLVLGVVAICLSRSRNGVLSMLVGGAVTAGLLHKTKYLRGMGWSLVGLVAVAFVVLMLVGFDPVYDRLQTLEDEDVYNFRLAIAADALTAFTRFPWFGSGQGSFADVFPLFDSTVRPGRAEHAENQYVELLVETGLVGFLLIAAFVVAVAVPWWRRLRSHRDGADGALFGLGFGLVAVGVHATSDFGLRIPSVAALALVLLAAIVGRTGGRSAAPAARWAAVGLSLLAGGGLLALLPGLQRERVAYEHAEAGRALGRRAAAAVDYDELLRLRDRERGHWAAAIEAHPAVLDYQVAYALSAWHSVVAAEQLEFQPVGAAIEPVQEQRMVAAARLVQQGLLEARRLGAIRGDLWSMVGQLGVEWLGDQGAAAWIERGFRHAPENPAACFAWARQLRKDGRPSAAMFARAIRMGERADRVLAAIADGFGDGELALQVARQDPRWLDWLVQHWRNDPAQQELAGKAMMELGTVLQQLVALPEPPAWALRGLARIEAEAGKTDAAIALYRRFLAVQPQSADRLALAELVWQQGDADGARQEARRVLNYNPGHGGAKRLIEDIDKYGPAGRPKQPGK